MITYQLSVDKLWALKFIDDISTGQWANIQTNEDYLKWISAGNTPLPPEGTQ